MGMPHATDRWTASAVRALPDDGNRYELIDGQLVVTPAPRGIHQVACEELGAQLRGALVGSSACHLLRAPADISLGEDEILQPDLFVYRTADGRALRAWSDIIELPLIIEVLSPSTARYDRLLKRVRYQRARVPEYWIVDLDARLVERWRPDDDRPEILTESLEWQPPDTPGPLVVDLPVFFASVLDR
jgi:Uma2 family endonuclease